MKTSIQIADYYIDNPSHKVGLALAIDALVTDKTKPLESEIKEQKNHIENLQDQIQFLEGRLKSRTQ